MLVIELTRTQGHKQHGQLNEAPKIRHTVTVLLTITNHNQIEFFDTPIKKNCKETCTRLKMSC